MKMIVIDGFWGINKMATILRHKLFNHLNALFSIFFLLVLILIFLIWQKFNDGAVLIASIFFAFDVLPALYLHIEYWIKNYRIEYEILSDRIIFNNRGRTSTYQVHDLEKIKLYKSASIKFPFFAFESYYYARIITKSGEELIITCLLTPKVEEEVRKLKGVPIEHKKRLFFNLDWK